VVEHDSFDRQARALYFDLGTSGEFKNIGAESVTPGHARTVDFVDSEYVASKRPGYKNTSSSSPEKEMDGKKSTNKQKYIE